MCEYNFNPELACLIGVDETIVISAIAISIRKNKANERHYYDGRYWTSQSGKAIREMFPFWDNTQLRKVFESLFAQEVLMKGNYNKTKTEKMGWYAISDKYKVRLLGGDVTLPFYGEDLAKKRKKFVPPTITEIKLVITDAATAQKFLNHYSSNGWMVGRNKMVDWQAAANNWKAENESRIVPINKFETKTESKASTAIDSHAEYIKQRNANRTSNY